MGVLIVLDIPGPSTEIDFGSQVTAKIESRDVPLSSPADAMVLPPIMSFLPQAPQARASASAQPQTRDQTVNQIPQIVGRDDRPTLGQTLQAVNSAAASIGRDDIAAGARDVPALALPNSDRAAKAPVSFAVPPMESMPPSTTNPAQPLAQAVADFAVAPYGILAVNMVNLDSTALCSSIKDFFEQIEQLGITLSENQIDFLYSTGIVVAATGLALEIVRRKVRPPTPALVYGRSPIPYSTTDVP